MSTRQQIRLYSFISLLLGMTSLAAQAQKNNFIIHGSIVDMPVQPDMVYLIYDTIMHKPDDSAVVRDGKYSFEGHIDEPVEVVIKHHLDTDVHLGGMKTTASEVHFLIQPGDIQVVSTGTMNQAVVTGSPAETDFRQADEGVRLWGDSLRQLYQLGLKTNNRMILSSIISEKNLNKMGGLLKKGYGDFIRDHPASTANIFLIRKVIGIQDAGWIDTLANLYGRLPVTLQTTYQGRIVGARLQDELKAAIGHKAPDFTQQDPDGHTVSLSSFKGKYVLLDFWAGWESDKGQYPLAPLMQKIYDTYGSKGLVILGVSLDADRGAWLQEIHEKDLGSTIQVCDLKGRNNAVAQLYGISEIPSGLLIDPHGVIVARGLTALNINKTLSAIFE